MSIVKFMNVPQLAAKSKMNRFVRSLGLEAEEVGAAIERERILFVELKDISQLDAAPVKVRHEQYEIKIPKSDKNALGGKIRVRKCTPVGEEVSQYFLTTKTHLPISDGASVGEENQCLEVTCETTEAVFTVFQYMAEGGMIKTRYEFPIEGSELKWEIDAFDGPNGKHHAWVKIDFEVPEDGGGDMPPLPVDAKRIISNPPDQRTDEENTILDMLFSTVFKVSNPHL